MNTKIAKFGIEVEGEFSQTLITQLKTMGEVKGDGSLRSCDNEDQHRGELYAREYITNPIRIDALQEAKRIFDIIGQAYKDKKFHFNSSCGFHIHVSFEPKFPPEIFSKQFTDYFLALLKSKQKTVIRKRGNNRFCRLNIEEKDIIQDLGDRYKFINLWPAFNRHGTIEFRIFPTNSPKAMYRYLVFTLSNLKKFLNKPIEQTFTATFDIDKINTKKITVSTEIGTQRMNLGGQETISSMEREIAQQLNRRAMQNAMPPMFTYGRPISSLRPDDTYPNPNETIGTGLAGSVGTRYPTMIVDERQQIVGITASNTMSYEEARRYFGGEALAHLNSETILPPPPPPPPSPPLFTQGFEPLPF